VLDSVILLLGLTHDTAIGPILGSPVYSACLDGTLDVSSASLFSPFSVPYVLVKRVHPIVDELRKILLVFCGTTSNSTLAEGIVLFKHKVIQFMRCYAIVARFCPKFYLAPLFEWMIAQCVEVTAILSMVSAASPSNAEQAFPKAKNACLWVQQNAAFVLCFIRGAHFQSLLANDYEQGLKAVVDANVPVEPDKSTENVLELMEGLKAQMTRLEQQEEMYFKCARSPDPQYAHEMSGTKLYRTMQELLRDATWNTVTALCISPKRVPELDTVVAPLYRVFEACGREMDLVHWAIDKDIGDGVKVA
jgi:hypothetical protein